MRCVLCLALLACGKQPGSGVLDQEAARGVFEQVPVDTPPGMSDLSIDDRGVLWAIAERDREVAEIELGEPPKVMLHPIEGVPAATDTEAIAWLGDGKFAIGTEGADEPTAAILFAELADDHLRVTHTRRLSSRELGVELLANHGIESMCGQGDELLAATECAGRLPDGTRYAALVRLRGEALSVTKVRLTSEVGKLSALSCTFAPDGTADVVAIERHYSVSRILRFTVRRGDAEVSPRVELDLAPILHDSLNLEGIARLPDGRLVAINDNQGKRQAGRTELLVFARR